MRIHHKVQRPWSCRQRHIFVYCVHLPLVCDEKSRQRKKEESLFQFSTLWINWWKNRSPPTHKYPAWKMSVQGCQWPWSRLPFNAKLPGTLAVVVCISKPLPTLADFKKIKLFKQRLINKLKTDSSTLFLLAGVFMLLREVCSDFKLASVQAWILTLGFVFQADRTDLLKYCFFILKGGTSSQKWSSDPAGRYT